MEYVAGGRLGTTKSPESEDVVVLVTPISLLRTVTVAFGTTAPVLSLTEPNIVPDVTWAKTEVLLRQVIRDKTM
jgi:hypothetical protein